MGAVVALRDHIHGNSIRDGREVFSIFPGGGAYHLYAVGFTSGTVKFGYAYNVRKRVKHHWRNAGGAVVWAHCFGRVEADDRGRCVQEQRTLAEAGRRGQRVGRSEFFRGLTKADAIACGRIGRTGA